MITKTFEPIRPLAAPDAPEPYCHKAIFGAQVVYYGECWWPSRSYWTVPGTDEWERWI